MRVGSSTLRCRGGPAQRARAPDPVARRARRTLPPSPFGDLAAVAIALHGSTHEPCRLAPAGRDVLRAAVYDYWLAKRQRRGQPLLRRLQAATPPNDNNPYNVFR